MRPGQSLIQKLLNIDHLVIDGAVRSVGVVSISAGSKLRSLQNGYEQLDLIKQLQDFNLFKVILGFQHLMLILLLE